MKKTIWITLSFILLGSAQAFAQNPVPDPDTISNPVQEGDPAMQTLPPRLDYVEDRKQITPDELPEPLKQTLESNAAYSNWREATLYHDQNKNEFIVEFDNKKTRTSYRFDNEGKPIVENEK